jgi:hypothetical protein
MMDSWTRQPPPAIGGWLLVLCALLIGWQPINLALSAARVLDALPVRGLPLALLLAARTIVAGFGIAAGIAILRHAGSAVALAKAALIASAALDIVVYTTPYFPNNRVPGDAPLFVAASLAYSGIWLLYLIRSWRVRNTFGVS